MRLLCVGDVVGVPGREIVRDRLPELVADRKIDCNIVNAENCANGSGLTPSLYKKLIQSGVDLITMGDHLYRRKEIIATLETSGQIVKPANLPAEAPGKSVVIWTTRSGQQVALFSLLGRMFMKQPVACPFKTADRILSQLPGDVRVIVCDVHAEATSEKVALGWHLDGRASVVFGTHTHVPTADEQILPGGTAYITDLGMTGPYDSILGRRKDAVLSSMITAVPTPFDVATEKTRMHGIIVDVSAETGRATSIERIAVPAAKP